MGLYQCLKPFAFCLPAELAHKATLIALQKGIGYSKNHENDPRLSQNLWGLCFKNPVGLAAGFDKDAEVIKPMLEMGFGAVELGSVTPEPQSGNLKPRVFRSQKDQAIINRMGFPSKGIAYFKKQISIFRKNSAPSQGLVGVNLGKNKATVCAADDYVRGIKQLTHYADYLVINVSSPNTPGLRDLQAADALREIIKRCQVARNTACAEKKDFVPLLVKIAPDLEIQQIKEMSEVFIAENIDGLVISNTMLARPKGVSAKFANERGGLSGQPLNLRSTQIIGAFYKETQGQIPIIGLGGVSSGKQAYEKIKSGASLVQLYTALVYQGPELVGKILKDLGDCLDQDGFKNITEAVGCDIKLKM